MNKRCIAAFLLLFLLISGCAGPSAPPQAPTAPPETTLPATEPPPTKAPLPETQPPTEPPSPVQALLDTMTLEEKVAQLFIVTPEQLWGGQAITVCPPDPLPYPVGGVILFGGNIHTPQQCTALIQGLQAASTIPLFVAVDEEGGTVARVSGNPAMGTTSFPNMARITTEEAAYNVGHTIGTQLQQFGFNLDFAPVADVHSNPKNPVIGPRSFGSDPEQVSLLVKAAVEGFRDSGILCTLKHFPGHGDTGTDSHTGYTQLDKNLDQLRQVEFPPFAAGIQAGADLVMVGHLSVPQVTGDALPATLSAELLSLLRQELGFQGLIITDSMLMGAITHHYSSGQAAVLALQAGVDLILTPYDLEDAIQGVLAAVAAGTFSLQRIDESVLRILELKYRQGILPAS